MSKTVILLLIIIVAVVIIFSVQNSAPVTVTFLLWRFEASLALIIFCSFLTGLILSWIVAFTGKIKHRTKRQD